MMKRCSATMIGCAALAVMLLTVPTASKAYAQNARDVARKAFPSVVVILAPQTKGKAVSLGSGFFVRPGIVATNYHVVKGSASLHVKLIGRNQSYAVGNVLSVDPNRDLALLTVDELDAPPLPFADNTELEVGDEIYAVGNPEGLEGTLSQGIVSGIRQLDGQQYIQITAAISHGSSGGPIFNKRGQVVGIAVAVLRSGQNLNFAIPGAYLAKLLAAEPLIARTPATAKATNSHRGNSEQGSGTPVSRGSESLESLDPASDEGKEILPLLAAAKRSPKSAMAHFNLAEACRKLFWVCHVGRASDEYLVATSLDPGYRDAYLRLGEIYREHALSIGSGTTPKWAEALDYLAEAVNCFVKAIALDPD